MLLRAGLLVAASLGLAACAAGQAPATSASPQQVGEVTTLDSAELAALIEAGKVILIDVRTPAEFAEARIPGSLLAPLDTFDPAAIPHEPGRETILYCRSSARSGRAARLLADYTGNAVRHLEGGLSAWQAAGLPVIPEPADK
jgi:rhodanese-related sulfurtransferase